MGSRIVVTELKVKISYCLESWFLQGPLVGVRIAHEIRSATMPNILVAF